MGHARRFSLHGRFLVIYQIRAPEEPLNLGISHFTYFRGIDASHTIERFLPDGNVEIVINLGDEPRYIYDNDTLVEKQACKRLWLSGIRTRYLSIPSSTGSEFFIIHFRKGRSRPFLKLPLCEIADQVIEGDEVLPKVYLELRERLLEAPSPSAKFSIANAVLRRQFPQGLGVPPLVSASVKMLSRNPSGQTMDFLTRYSGYSARHFIEIFRENIGLAPKVLQRILRFQKAIAEITTPRMVSWRTLAQECGYYDQSHFNSDFKEFSGINPTLYRLQVGAEPNYLPIR